ncbi:MAG: T9SS C-terminal target domain-containing protein [Ignavibacteriae bacterium]|nr:MAG: T9SS C-terminal target domain-containing protein [Ignavibacteriota bacterium]
MMRTLNTALLLLALVLETATAQRQHFWIVVTHKTGTASLQKSQMFGISERALNRRAKSLPPDRLIDELDVPISESILSQLKQTGVKIRTVSRWLNAVSVEATPEQIQVIYTLPFVARTEPVLRMVHPEPLTAPVEAPVYSKSTDVMGIDYGPSETQLTNMNVVELHALGVNGAGVLIGMLDDGFNNFRTHRALKNIRIIADSDFIHNINDVSIQPWEIASSPGQGNHGSGTLSAVGGFDSGHLIGAAFGASFILAKTEMDSSGSAADFNSEEDTYVAGIEWAERLGADITSSSLGYKQFLSPPTYTTSDMNGKTTKVARVALIASRKGVLVVTAMGNDGFVSGNGTSSQRALSTLISPADADSIISVGAASSDGELASFSGCGPTADGRIKPEVIAQGRGIYWADGTGTTGYTTASGTSCATPLVAGAAALILSAHPELTNMQVRDALMRTTTQRVDGTPETAVYPNNFYGYGFVNAYAAAVSVGPVFSNLPSVTVSDTQLTVSTFVVSNSGILPDSIFLYYRTDNMEYDRVHLLPTGTPNEYQSVIPLFPSDTSVVGYFVLSDSTGKKYKYPSRDSMQYLQRRNFTVPQTYTLLQNYPNPFNTSTTILFSTPETGMFEVTIFNLLGQHVKTLFHGSMQPGSRTLSWNGTDEGGRTLATGIYFALLKAPHGTRSIKLLYLK